MYLDTWHDSCFMENILPQTATFRKRLFGWLPEGLFHFGHVDVDVRPWEQALPPLPDQSASSPGPPGGGQAPLWSKPSPAPGKKSCTGCPPPWAFHGGMPEASRVPFETAARCVAGGASGGQRARAFGLPRGFEAGAISGV